MSWVNSNKKAAWCKGNSVCMDVVQKALTAATTEETHLIDEWLHVSSLMNLNIWDDIKKDTAKAGHWIEGAGHTIYHGLSVAG